jgi:hypothetical protein
MSSHLRQLEIDRLLAQETHGLEAALLHLEACDACRSRLEVQRQEQLAFVEPRAQAEAEKLLFLAAQRSRVGHRARVLKVVGSVAAAAVIAILCFPALRGHEALPEYSLSVSHGSQTLRDGSVSASTVPRFAPHSRLRLDLRPAKTFRGVVEARVWAEQDDRLERVPLAVKTSAEGAVRLEGVVGDHFFLSPGQYTLWVIVFQRGDYDDNAAVRAAIARGGLPGEEGAILSAEVVIDAENKDQSPVFSPH